MQNHSYLNAIPQTAGFSDLMPAVNTTMQARVEVLTQIGKVEPIWRELVHGGAVCSRYQHYSWMRHWWDHIGSRSQAEPLITILRNDAGKPVLLLPLIRKRVGPVHIGYFMGGKHTNFNLPVWRPGLLGESDTGLETLLKGLQSDGPRIDLLCLLNQPATGETRSIRCSTRPAGLRPAAPMAATSSMISKRC